MLPDNDNSYQAQDEQLIQQELAKAMRLSLGAATNEPLSVAIVRLLMQLALKELLRNSGKDGRALQRSERQ
ncbi:hypothetical protein OGR47_11305 [Methylocystis sp. MJC1]|jgi:hypothetical protein|uniref:hypothetical protein n=1 Tax=Methylocystis sp. MJC1 TaxID=2654282 RepID=UPI0013ECBB79|nr:hypothetical protein [Methylocystis sp. MJC1]KAF2990179.1 hypothetical protein MJC1_02841 [Methylocystis sp. MJC1]MBU6527570.1 hypothetical protein [Methylocystis sp. MJC1]UZX10509.1 hypothetical protein OGR47_11305 [Methylocystis sp. MJC1]